MSSSLPLQPLRPGGPTTFERDDPHPESSAPTGPHLDGGFGWVIIFCAFVLAFQGLGILYAWGVVQAHLAEKKLASPILLSVIGATSAFWVAFSCLPISWAIRRYGDRTVALAGVVSATTSLALSGFATDSLGGLIFLQGVCYGISSGMLYLPAYTIPSQYFDKKRGLATGIASSGGALGGAFWSLPAAYTLRSRALATRSGTETPLADERVERSIFRSSRYIRVLFASFVASYPFFIPPFFISQYARSIGQTAAQGALYSALFNIASGIGRIAFGVVADFMTGNLNAWIISVLLIVLSTLIVWPRAMGEGLIILLVAMCGMGSGGFFSLQSSIVSQILGNHRLGQGMGWLEVAESFGYFAGPVSAGALLQAFGGPGQGAAPYRPAMQPLYS
ncbi:major facilitator superfamily domain-containing protein [Filobasidium floriforme]|uniref:major facilitator superfamily domain-containing protein n=1 Tax=Filobasidium floriforme TaxID=5210 RepID=UPI001E8D3B67|nr:major facilitator superfamily domain-containing protein [Filobasidium floriforme]KAH8085933.1 major facilitator superfamily domain-containing protein [Filobasidium floriforme]